MNNLFKLMMQNKGKGKGLVRNSTVDTLDIYIDDVICADDWYGGISAKSIQVAIDGFSGSQINIYINSPGGDIFEARAIVSMLNRINANITVFIDGMAASCASWLALAGDEVVMAEGTMLMIHQSWTFCMDNSTGLRKTADLLDTLDNTFVDEYMAAITKHGKDTTREQVVAFLNAETWFTPQQALDLGFIDRIDRKTMAKSSNYDLSAYSNAPKPLLKSIEDSEKIDAEITAQVARNERHLRILAAMC